ncbi:MAG: hypothetical protein L3J31_01940 [Bacteroidales bacterium]|nr:hypothetical protein [Bacteroidales bacterium]MCF6341552.1 hypothetical protein [Bacteroidales bacterium]
MDGQWYSHGKLLLTGEYLVMEGAKAFALPLKQGQSLKVQRKEKSRLLEWKAVHREGEWFRAVFRTSDFSILQTDNPKLAANLSRILQAVRKLSAGFLQDTTGILVETKLDFRPEYGFGSSSTLISNLAWWAEINPYDLLRLSFGGSGFDLACARAGGPLFFRLKNGLPLVQQAAFDPPFKDNIYFVYLGRKQRSKESIRSFNKTAAFEKEELENISRIGQDLVSTNSLAEFEDLLNLHEKMMAAILGRPTVKSQLFNDYLGTVKSLGGWGGDFVLVTSLQADSSFRADMQKRGFPVVYGYDDLVL